jgi:MOSC domain-containing protein YiiM
MRPTRLARHALHGPWGDSARHLPFETLEKELAKLAPPADRGTLALICSRGDDGTRATPDHVVLTREQGVPGDAWYRDSPDAPEAQIAVMRADFARLVANGQSIALAGDNLFVELDLSAANLPIGSRLRIGQAVLEVTPKAHNGCMKFRQRFGADALRLTADPTYRPSRLRGLYLRVVEPGAAAVGDPVVVLSRASESA